VPIRIITHEDGLASSECNQGAYLKDSEGNLWIGTISGVTRYNPAADLPSQKPPRTHITRIQHYNFAFTIIIPNSIPNPLSSMGTSVFVR
jgi:hypothetical protein